MKFRNRFREEPEINLIPLIDVLLVTIIFLLVTTSFSQEARLKLQLPQAGASAKTDTPTLRVTIDATGQYYINNHHLLNQSPDTIRRAMQEAAGNRRNPIVVIQADRKTPHESVIRVLDVARQLGFTQLSFATQQGGDKSAP